MPCLQRPLYSQDPLGARGLGVAAVASHNQRHAKGKEPVGCPIQGPAWGWGLKDDSPGSAGTLLHGQYRDPCASRGRCSPSLRPGVPAGLSAQRQVWFSGSSRPCHLSPVESASVPRPGTLGQGRALGTWRLWPLGQLLPPVQGIRFSSTVNNRIRISKSPGVPVFALKSGSF